MKVGGVAKSQRRIETNRRLFLGALAIDSEPCPANVHARGVAIELAQLIVLQLVAHRRVVYRKHRQQWRGILGANHDALGRIHLRPQRRPGRGIHGGRVPGGRQHVHTVEGMRALIGHDAA